MVVTIKDIALLSGVSHQAVSAALNPNSKSRVSAATRERILKIAGELNYIPNAAAKALNAGSAKIIGILGNTFSNLQGSYYDEVAAIFAVNGYAVLNSYCDFRSDIRPALNSLLAAGAGGILVMSNADRNALAPKIPVPYVFWANLPQKNSDVYVDTIAGAELAIQHFNGHGRKKIAFIEPQKNLMVNLALNQAAENLDVEPFNFVTMREFNGQFQPLLKHLRQNKIDAIFASNDYVGAKFIKCCFDHQVKVPQEFAVIGNDGYSFTEFSPCSLTTLIQPVRVQAEAAAKLLLSRIDKGELHSVPAGIRILPELYIGNSCGCATSPQEQLYQINTYPLLETDRRLNFAL